MNRIELNDSVIELNEKELIDIDGGNVGPGDAAYSVGYGAVISQVMLAGGIIPAGYLTYKWALRMFD